MRIFGRILLNQAGGDKPGGGGGGAPVDPNAAMLEMLSKLQSTLADLPKSMEAAANKAVHGAFAKQKKGEPPPKEPKDDDDDPDDLDVDAAAAAAGAGAAGAGKEKPSGGGAPAPDSAAARELRRVTRKLKQLEDDRTAEKAQASARKLAAERAEDRAALAAVLGGKVKPELLDAAVALHFDAKGRVKRERETEEEDGRRVWVDGDDSTTIEDGVAKWLSSPEGKAYVPPLVGGGSGNRGGQGAVGADGKRVYSDADLGAALFGGGKPR